MSTATDDRTQAIIEGERANLMSGRYFRLVAASERSVRSGGCVSRREGFARAVQVLGHMAGRSDAYAQIASAILRTLPLYQTDHEAVAKMYETAADVLAKPYDDVVGRSGPECGPLSSYLRDWSLAERITIAAYLKLASDGYWLGHLNGLGWAVQALVDELGIVLPVVNA